MYRKSERGFDYRRHEQGMAGRGGRGRWNPPAASNRQQPLPLPDISQTQLRIIKPEELSQLAEDIEAIKVKDCQSVASYNWLEKKEGAILVPGLPPTWCPPSQVSKLKEDDPNGTYYRDQNAARYPAYPLDPAVRAIFDLNSDYSSLDVDVFSCASVLGNLMGFVKNKESRTFRFGVERIGNTIFLVRKPDEPKEVIKEVYGYGHTFPEAYTSWEESVKGSASNQRIISYVLGGLKCLIRSECDGILPGKIPSEYCENRKPDTNIEVDGDLTDRLDNIFTSQATPTGKGSPIITQAGRMIPQSSIFDIKTLSVKKKPNFDSAVHLPRYWINQTPNAIIAWHTNGSFHDIQIKDVREEVGLWEEENAPVIARLHLLLQNLIQFSKQPGQSQFEVRRTDHGPLELWSEVKGWSALPEASKAKWKNEPFEIHAESSDSEDETADYLKF